MPLVSWRLKLAQHFVHHLWRVDAQVGDNAVPENDKRDHRNQVSENQPEQEIIEKSFSYFHPSCEAVAKSLEEEFIKKDRKGYQFEKSLYTYDIFDSSIEFQFAKLIDKIKEVKK